MAAACSSLKKLSTVLPMLVERSSEKELYDTLVTSSEVIHFAMFHCSNLCVNSCENLKYCFIFLDRLVQI